MTEKIFVSPFCPLFCRLCRRAVSSAAVPSTAAPLPGTAETAGTAEAAATPAPTADAVQPPQGLVETGAAVLDYDEIRLIDYFREYPASSLIPITTMCRDGKWGLMRSDGTEVLPCRAPEPLFECGLGNRHWHDYTNGLSWEEIEPLQERLPVQLKETGDGVICDGHDGDGYLEFVYLRMPAGIIYSGSLGPGEFSAPTEDDLLRYSGSARRHRTHLRRYDHTASRRLVLFCQRWAIRLPG